VFKSIKEKEKENSMRLDVNSVLFIFSYYRISKMAGQYPKRVLSTKRRVDHGAGVSKSGIAVGIGMPVFSIIRRRT
jgi:hypothetical protein